MVYSISVNSISGEGKKPEMIPNVAILMESSLEVSRGILLGIVNYIRLHQPWSLRIVQGGIGDQRLPADWNGDGVIARIPTPDVADELACFKGPKVILDPQAQFLVPSHPLAGCSLVANDYAADGRAAADYFLVRGFRHFAYVGPAISSAIGLVYDKTNLAEPNWAAGRRRGFATRLEKAGFTCEIYPLTETLRESKDWKREKPRLETWLRTLPKPVAIFAAHDSRGCQVTDACLAAGIPVPYQAAVLGVNNDLILCETSQPPLSSIPLDSAKAGWMAAELLDKQMRGRLKRRQIVTYRPLPVVTRASTEQYQTDDPLVIAALETIRKTRGFRLYAPDLAQRLKVSIRWLEKRFRRTLNRTVADVIRDACLENVRELVVSTDLPFRAIAAECGQSSPSHLAAAFRARFGVTMTAARRLPPPISLSNHTVS